MISPYVFPLLFAGLLWQPVQAAPLYKWMDSTGHVTYSSLPPPSGARAQTIEIQPQPSAEETRQAEARAKRMQEQASDLEARRREQEAREAEDARLRAMQPPPPVVIEQPVYVPQPIYYPPVRARPRPHHDKHPHPRTR